MVKDINKKELYVVRKVSRKEGREDFYYVQLFIDFGYAKRVITMENNLIAEITELPIRCLFELELDKPVKIGEFELKGE